MKKGSFLAVVFGGLLVIYLVSLTALRLFGARRQEVVTENRTGDGQEAVTDGEWGEDGGNGDDGPDRAEGENAAEDPLESAGPEDTETAGMKTGQGEAGNEMTGDGGAPEGTSGEALSGNGISGQEGAQNGTAEGGVSENRIPAGDLLHRQRTDVSGNGVPGGRVSGNGVPGGRVSGNGVPGGRVSGNGVPGGRVSGNGVPGGRVSGNGVPGGRVSGNGVWDDGSSGSQVSGNGVSGNAVSGNGVSGNTLSGNAVSGDGISRSVSENAVMTLAQRQKTRSSHKETLLANARDKETISGNHIDFSDIRIACLGDSITEASNLENLEDYRTLSYPSILGKVLGAKEVYNLGIGGSSIGRYWADAFVDRYQEIPEDADLILIMGGTNDGFCASLVEFGTSAERKERTFWGDLDDLMDGLEEDYPHAEVIFLTPLPNGLHDYLKKDHPYLIGQEKYAEAIRYLAAEHGMEVIDLYNSNILDGHDKDNALHLMPDTVHPNAEGYRILGEHVAAEIIRLLESRQEGSG